MFYLIPRRFLHLLDEKVDWIMAKIDDLNAAAATVSAKLDKLTSDVATAISILQAAAGSGSGGGITDAQLQPAIDLLNGLITKEDALDATLNLGTGTGTGGGNLASATIAPPTFAIAVGAVQSLVVSTVGSDGNPFPATPTWASSDPTIATVDGNGNVTGVLAGSVTITVSFASPSTVTASSSGTVS
jgi:hypothetical protein